MRGWGARGVASGASSGWLQVAMELAGPGQRCYCRPSPRRATAPRSTWGETTGRGGAICEGPAARTLDAARCGPRKSQARSGTLAP